MMESTDSGANRRGGAWPGDRVGMQSIDGRLRSGNYFLRRRDLLGFGHTDAQIRDALATHRIFRVRQGWYSVPDAPPPAVEAVRVGGRLTSVSALESYGLPVPRRADLHVAVPSTACRLRAKDDRRTRLSGVDAVRVHWVDERGRGGTVWRVSMDDALLAVLIEEPRDIAVACASAVMRHARWSAARLGAVFDRAPRRVQAWRSLVSALDDSHGETFFRLWFGDAGLSCEQQVRLSRVGRLDFRVASHTYVEIDGAQHDPDWLGETASSWERDHDRDTTVVIGGGTVLRYTYRQLYTDWRRVLAAIERAIADDAALAAYRARHPYRPRVRRKRRRSVAKTR
jgi:very-short-patch-repair endonuclease